MKTSSLIAAALLLAGCSHSSTPATTPRDPDFVETKPMKSAVPAGETASDGTRPIEPTDVVQFTLASADLSSAANDQIARSTEFLTKHPGERLVLEGHTDRSGSFAYNEDLALRRAVAVRDRVVANGIAVDRVVVAIFGESQADPGVNGYDRRVVMFASHRPQTVLVKEEIAKERALSITYSENGKPTVVDGSGRGAVGAR